MTKIILTYIRENIDNLVKIAIIYLVSIVIGMLIFNMTSFGKEFCNVVNDVFSKTKESNFEGINLLSNGIKNNLIYIAILLLSTFFIFCFPVISSCIIFKGISVGMYMASCFKIFGFFKGMGFSFLDIIIPQLFCIFGYILFASVLLQVHYIVKNHEKIASSDILKYAIIIVFSLCLISFSIVFEQLISPVCINIYTNIN